MNHLIQTLPLYFMEIRGVRPEAAHHSLALDIYYSLTNPLDNASYSTVRIYHKVARTTQEVSIDTTFAIGPGMRGVLEEFLEDPHEFDFVQLNYFLLDEAGQEQRTSMQRFFVGATHLMLRLQGGRLHNLAMLCSDAEQEEGRELLLPA